MDPQGENSQIMWIRPLPGVPVEQGWMPDYPGGQHKSKVQTQPSQRLRIRGDSRNRI
jgi:hypothetical protein